MERRDGDGIGNPKSVSDFEGVEASSVFWIPRSVYCSSVSTRRITLGSEELEVDMWNYVIAHFSFCGFPQQKRAPYFTKKIDNIRVNEIQMRLPKTILQQMLLATPYRHQLTLMLHVHHEKLSLCFHEQS